MASIAREVAWRVFAGEYNAAKHTIRGEGDRAPNYQLSPLGARMNRIYLVGVLTYVENAGSDAEPLWRGRVSDPTGVFYLSAGQFDPGASKALSEMEPPQFVAVIGKARAYSPEEGTTFLSVRPEVIKVVDENERSHWVLEACRSTLKRLDAMQEAMGLDEPTAEKLVSLGYTKEMGANAVEALGVYGPQDLDRYRHMVLDTLGALASGGAVAGGAFPEAFPPRAGRGAEGGGPVRDAGPPADEPDMEFRTRAVGDRGAGGDGPAGTDGIPGAPEEEEEDEGAGTPPPSKGGNEEDRNCLLDVISVLDTEDTGASYNDIINKCEKRGLKREAVDELINTMLIEGDICEPVLGRIKKV